MRIRFGYVAIALDIWGGSPNKTITYTSKLIPMIVDVHQ